MVDGKKFSIQIAESKTFFKSKKSLDAKLYQKINWLVYPELVKNPFLGTNIKKLKGNWSDCYRYRIGNYHLFYFIDLEQAVVVIIALSHRQSSYK